MKKVIEGKIKSVEELKNEINSAKSIVIFEYLGLTAKKISDLRKTLHNANAKMYVCKNNIFNRAFKDSNNPQITNLKGPTAVIISKGDEIVAFREISELLKEFKFINFKSGILDGSVVGIDKLQTIASLPNKNGLLSMLLSVLKAGITKFAFALNEVKSTKN
ncbi:MAG: 50S ribosomal protein L10 [Mycoplasmataceae bacterium]|jgi:large subunit ribosomal protein L10|nr:50S ribosomal protein L10 [Mycoplasmataceae bacterium]